MGLAVLLFDYRGYGGNPGHPTEEGLAADARAALGYLAGRPEVDPERVIYFGESLGAAVALRLATERPPAALVLRSPFASLAEVGRRHYPVLPVSLLLRDRYDSAALAGRLDAPLLVVAGGRDQIVPAATAGACSTPRPSPSGWSCSTAPTTTTTSCSPAPGSWPSCGPSSTASAACAAEPTRRGLPRPSRGGGRDGSPSCRRCRGAPVRTELTKAALTRRRFDRRPEEVAAARRFVRGG